MKVLEPKWKQEQRRSLQNKVNKYTNQHPDGKVQQHVAGLASTMVFGHGVYWAILIGHVSLINMAGMGSLFRIDKSF